MITMLRPLQIVVNNESCGTYVTPCKKYNVVAMDYNEDNDLRFVIIDDTCELLWVSRGNFRVYEEVSYDNQ